jgi:hypothetical protein
LLQRVVPGVHSHALVPVHTPVQTAPFAAHCALVLQTWGAPLKQRVLPGAHTPLHEPPLQRYGHAVPFAHVPLLLHVCGVRPLQRVVPGLQSVHWAEMHVYWQTSFTVHCPALLQMACTTALSLARRPQARAFGLHTPVQALVPLVVLQTAGHAELCHCPFTSQVCSVVPEHWVAPGLQTPVHVPRLQTNGHGCPSTHLPD